MYSTSHTSPSVTVTMPAVANATVSMPQLITPPDIHAYLIRMDCVPSYGSSGTMWQRAGKEGYMTWEQAVVYCLVKPWLVEEA